MPPLRLSELDERGGYVEVSYREAQQLRAHGYKVSNGLGPPGGPKVLDGYWALSGDIKALRVELALEKMPDET